MVNLDRAVVKMVTGRAGAVPIACPTMNLRREYTGPHVLFAAVMLAIIRTESAGRPFAVRYEPRYKWLHEPARFAKLHGITTDTERALQRMSYGLTQIMGATARSEAGFSDPLPRLFDAETNIAAGAIYFAKLIDRYSGSLDDAIAAYNAGSVRKKPNGEYVNQVYHDRVMENLQ